METDQPLFIEKQHFTQWYIWSLLILVMLSCLYVFISQILFHHPVGSNPGSDAEVTLVCILPLGLLLLFRFMSLTTTVYADSIRIQFAPFFSKTIRKSDISKWEIIKYRFVGYGIRLGSSYGTVYNIKGNTGLQIISSTGKKWLIGTQKGAELKDALQSSHA